jgi:hypothetical protein
MTERKSAAITKYVRRYVERGCEEEWLVVMKMTEAVEVQK